MAEELEDAPWAGQTPSRGGEALPDAPWAGASPKAATWGQTATDVGKQVLAAVPRIPEIAATGPAQVLGLAGRAANYFFPGDPEREAEQQKTRELVAKQGGSKGIDQYLWEAQTPEGKIARTATEFAGSLGTGALGPAGAAKGVLPYLAQEAGPVAKMAGLGAVTGAASEMAGMATEGTPWETTARMATALAGPAAANKFGKAFAYRGAPTHEALEDSVNARYGQVRELGVELKPSTTVQALNDIRGLESVDEVLAPKTNRLLERYADELVADKSVSFDKIESLRRKLSKMTINKLDPTEADGARTAVRGIDDFLADLKPENVLKGDATQFSNLAKTAREEASANFRMRAMDALRQRAEDTAKTGQSAERAYRNQLKAFVRPNNKGVSPAMREGFNKQEIAELRKASHMKSVDAMLRTIGIAGGYLGMAGLGGATYFTHDPEYAGAAALGYGARKLGGIRARMGANKLARMTASRSPLAREMGVKPPVESNLWENRLAISRPGLYQGSHGFPFVEAPEGFKKGGRVTRTIKVPR